MFNDVLTPDGALIFPKLKNFNGYYMAGGTAMALQMEHRISVDFDFFSDKKIAGTLFNEIKKTFPKSQISVLVNNRDEFTVVIDNVKVTFLTYPFKIVRDLAKIEGLPMLSIPELAATKAYTIGRRRELKDYVDLYFALAGNYVKLPDIIEIATQKYSDVFNARLFLEQLVSISEIPDVEITFLKPAPGKEEMQSFFISETKKISL